MNRAWTSVVLALAVAAPGCGPDIQAFCEAQENCLGGNESDIDACVVIYEGGRDNADDIGCLEEFDAAFECGESDYECMTAGACTSDDDCFGSACMDGECKFYGVDPMNADRCEIEVNAYERCD